MVNVFSRMVVLVTAAAYMASVNAAPFGRGSDHFHPHPPRELDGSHRHPHLPPREIGGPHRHPHPPREIDGLHREHHPHPPRELDGPHRHPHLPPREIAAPHRHLHPPREVGGLHHEHHPHPPRELGGPLRHLHPPRDTAPEADFEHHPHLPRELGGPHRHPPRADTPDSDELPTATALPSGLSSHARPTTIPSSILSKIEEHFSGSLPTGLATKLTNAEPTAVGGADASETDGADSNSLTATDSGSVERREPKLIDEPHGNGLPILSALTEHDAVPTPVSNKRGEFEVIDNLD